MKNAIYKVFLICILCNVFMLCITHPKVYAQQNVKVTLDKYIEKFIKEQNIPELLLQLYIIKKYSSQKRWGLLENLKKGN